MPVSPQVGDNAAQSEAFTPKPPEHRPSPAGPRCSDPPSLAHPHKHSLGKEPPNSFKQGYKSPWSSFWCPGAPWGQAGSSGWHAGGAR